MAKVLYQNNSDNIVTCSRCKSVVEYDKSEVQSIKHSYDYLGWYIIGVYRGIKCPQCDKNIFTDRRR